MTPSPPVAGAFVGVSRPPRDPSRDVTMKWQLCRVWTVRLREEKPTPGPRVSSGDAGGEAPAARPAAPPARGSLAGTPGSARRLRPRLRGAARFRATVCTARSGSGHGAESPATEPTGLGFPSACVLPVPRWRSAWTRTSQVWPPGRLAAPCSDAAGQGPGQSPHCAPSRGALRGARSCSGGGRGHDLRPRSQGQGCCWAMSPRTDIYIFPLQE